MEQVKPKILFVDDEAQNLLAFKSAFRRTYQIHTAESAKLGIQILRQEDIQVIITDQRMPEMTGTEFLTSILVEFPEPMRIILTGYSDVEAVIQAINQGEVYRYLTKPWNKEELKITIDNALQTYQLRKENQVLVAQLQEANTALEAKVKARTLALEQSQHELAERYTQLGYSHQKLSEQNEMIDLLLRELNHRVLNNLQVVSAVLGRESEVVRDSQVLEIVQRVEQRINDMARIHQFLMYRNSQEAAIDLADYFKEITAILSHMYFANQKAPHIQIDTQGLRMKQERTYFLGFIVHELVTNSFKYAFQCTEKPCLKISLSRLEAEVYQLCIEDNGVGLPPELVEQDQIKFELIQSMGLKIINLIAKIHQGQLSVKTDAREGACFEINLQFKKD